MHTHMFYIVMPRFYHPCSVCNVDGFGFWAYQSNCASYPLSCPCSGQPERKGLSTSAPSRMPTLSNRPSPKLPGSTSPGRFLKPFCLKAIPSHSSAPQLVLYLWPSISHGDVSNTAQRESAPVPKSVVAEVAARHPASSCNTMYENSGAKAIRYNGMVGVKM